MSVTRAKDKAHLSILGKGKRKKTSWTEKRRRRRARAEAKKGEGGSLLRGVDGSKENQESWVVKVLKEQIEGTRNGLHPTALGRAENLADIL